MEQTKKKKHVGLAIFLILLGLILLFLGLCYGYLRLMGFDTAEKQAQYDAAAACALAPVYAANGTTTARIGAADMYWLRGDADLAQTVSEETGGLLTLDGWYAEPHAGGITVYADLMLKGFLPLPVKAELSAVWDGQKVQATLTQLWLGQKLQLPLESMLARFGMEDTFSFDTEELGIGRKVDDLRFTDGAIEVDRTFVSTWLLKNFLYARDEARLTWALAADQLTEHPLSALGTCFPDGSVTADALYRAAAADPAEFFTGLFALMGTDKRAILLNELNAFDTRFILCVNEANIESVQAELYGLRAARQADYETLVSALRQRYQSMELTLDAGGFIDSKTGEALDLAALCPALGLDAASCRVVLLYSTDPINVVAAAQMPAITDVPNTGAAALAGIDTALDYDLGVLLTLPSGIKAMCYMQADRRFVFQCLPADRFEVYMTQPRLPVAENTQSMERGAVRILVRAQDGSVSDCVLLLSEYSMVK